MPSDRRRAVTPPASLSRFERRHGLRVLKRRGKVLRGLFERERSLLGLLARAGYEAVRRVLEAAGEGEDAAPRDAVPAFVASIQTFGSYANLHPHVHALVTEGVFARDGTLHAVAWPPSGVLEEVLRRLLLAALARAERLTEEFAANLASWRHSGFSVYAVSRVDALDLDGLARLARLARFARYVTRPALATGAVTIREDVHIDESWGTSARRQRTRALGPHPECPHLDPGLLRELRKRQPLPTPQRQDLRTIFTGQQPSRHRDLRARRIPDPRCRRARASPTFDYPHLRSSCSALRWSVRFMG